MNSGIDEGPKSTYLVTYSQAKPEKVDSREHFAEIVANAFNHGGEFNRVVQWACCKEFHQNGGAHYHLALKLDSNYRWKQVKFKIMFKHGISVHFQNFSTGYHDAYQYVTKEDVDFITSPGHPAVGESPQNKKALLAKSSKSKASSDTSNKSKTKRAKRLSPSELHDLIVANNIRDDDDFCSHAKKMKKEGDSSLANLVMSKDEKRRKSMITSAWKLEESEEVVERKRKNRLEILKEEKLKECRCEGRWRAQAEQTLELNGIDPRDYWNSVFTLLEKGRGKHRNIIHVGPSNCGKTFLIEPLVEIFKCFESPAKGTLNWVNAEKKECVILNDFRWSEQIIPWSDFLNLLEGKHIHIPVPKTHYVEDVLWTNDTPIFATAGKKIRKYEAGEIDEIETEMMDSRWKVFLFRHRISKEDIVEMEPCCRCFSELVLRDR